MLFLIPILVFLDSLSEASSNDSKVVVPLYGTATLHCSFSFIGGSEGVTVVWVKTDKDGRSLIVHKFTDGQDDLRDQDMSYMERTELSNEFSQGTVDLTLHDVTFTDEGTYFCRAANKKGHGDKEVKLTINDLNAADSVVTVVHIDGKKRLKCVDTGMFRNPWVRWYDAHGTDLSEHGDREISHLSDGRKMVKSVLHMDVERNKHYFCQVKEGRLKRTARAVISDGETVTVPETKLPD